MKILLINPPRSPHNGILAGAPPEALRFIHRKLIGPPLGLLTVAAAIPDHDVTVFDCKGEYDLDPAAPSLPDLVRREVDRCKPDIVGVTCIASEVPAGLEILREVRRIDPAILTVAGGLHVTLCPGDFAVPEVDLLCPGTGAFTFRGVVLAAEKKRGFANLPGVIENTPSGFKPAAGVRGCDAGRENALLPDRSAIRRWISTYRVGDAPSPSTYLYTSLGCPYQCSFCSIWPQHRGAFYQRDIDEIIAELTRIDEYGVVRFADANTIIDPPFIDRLCDRIAAEGIRKTYIMDIRFDTAAKHPALIEKLARIGLKVVICGFESFREEELARYRKGAPAKLIAEAIKVFHDNGIMLRGNYVVPPDYTLDDFRALADYASQHPVVYAGYTVLTPMPGTQFHAEVKEHIVDFDLAKYNFFNSVLPTTLPLERFYEEVGRLWLIKKGNDVI